MKKSVITVLLAASSAFAASAATLTPMNGVSLLYVNGQESESKIRSNDVESGTTQVVVRMDKKVGRGSSQSVYTSAPYVITFNISGDEVKINHPVARSKQEASAAFRLPEPEWRITQDGNSLSYTVEKLKGREGAFPYSGIGELIAEYNEQRGITFGSESTSEVASAAVAATATTAAATTAAVATSTPKAVEKPQVVKPGAKSSNMEQLKALYLKASKAERKEFRKWMIDQE
ncbi:DUF2057 family protein [Vibrio variabilis]|uniref:DUF2057 family protein n=1 Tax=Vibrio variabilis TaxID=990271 RepID=UPI000DDAF9AF|nr:DUF2057 family protein [Vibrio variabilis]